jgi:putative DNA primase/helicase
MGIKISNESGSTNDKPFDDKRELGINELQKTLKDYDEHLLMTSTKSTTIRMKAVNDLAEDFKLPKPYPDDLSTSIETKDKTSSTALDVVIDIHETELGNALRLVKLHGHNIKFCHTYKKWLIWDGARWQINDKGQVKRLAKDTIKKIYREAARSQSEKERKKLAEHAWRSESNQKVNAMLSLAESEEKVAITADVLDSDNWLLNCKNGVLDLKNQILRPHLREHFITKLSGTEYNLEMECPRWQRFLETITDKNENIIKYLQKAVGYSLTGNTSEQCLFLLYGTGANGKSTFVEVMRGLLNDYAKQADFSTFLAKKHDQIRNDIAMLKGARFVSAIEAQEGRALAEVLVKQLTGGDTITSRFLHQEFFEYMPTFKIWLACNHRPIIKGNDWAIWRRIKVIPFDVVIPESLRIKDYAAILKEELPGILNWAIEGCQLWMEEGLKEPNEIKAATLQYRDEMDIINDFLTECCEYNINDKVVKSELYKKYLEWCKGTGEYQLTQRKFGMRIKEKGIDEYRLGSQRFWKGISIKA